jgi:hypothetical protein
VVHSFFKRSSISTEFTFDVNGDIVSTSSMDKSTSRKRERLESTTTPRYGGEAGVNQHYQVRRRGWSTLPFPGEEESLEYTTTRK